MTDISLDEATLWHVEEGHEITDSVAFHGPPGTGKTTTAAATVGKLIRDHGYDISDVCWVTYRRSLARDTLKRLVEWDVLDQDQLEHPRKGATRYIGTAHAVGNRCADIGEQPVKEWQRNDFCERRDMRYWTQEPWEDSAGKLLFRVFDYLANDNSTPEDAEALHQCPHLPDLRDHWTGDIVDAWYEWQDYKAQRELIDFHEMLKRPLKQGATPERPILVVDEYHDVTQLMHDLFQSWMEDAEIVLAAGDPHQVVNAYDGASPEYFESLDLPQVLLPKTFRCRPEHWGIATSMLAKSHEPPAVDIVEESGLVNEYNSPRFEYSSENGWITTPAPDQPGSPGWINNRYSGSTLFLARTQMQADGVGAALEDAGVPYRTQKELSGWNTEEGSTRLNLHNALQKIEGYSPQNFNYGANAAFAQFSGDQRDPKSEDLSSDEAATMLDAASAHTLDITRSEANDRADELRDSDDPISLYDFDDWVTETFWERYTAGAASVDRINKSVFGSSADRELHALRRALAVQEDAVDPGEINTWSITIHASKGMEADDVVVYDGVSNRIRSEMMANDRTRKNEHRTWYVALSRAKKRLHIMRNGFEWTTGIIPENLQEAVS